MSGLRTAPRKGENFELAADLNSEYKEKRKDAIKRVIANMTVQKGKLYAPPTRPADANQVPLVKTSAGCSRTCSRTCRRTTLSRRSSSTSIS